MNNPAASSGELNPERLNQHVKEVTVETALDLYAW
jgi:hypothetical protein